MFRKRSRDYIYYLNLASRDEYNFKSLNDLQNLNNDYNSLPAVCSLSRKILMHMPALSSFRIHPDLQYSQAVRLNCDADTHQIELWHVMLRSDAYADCSGKTYICN